MNKIIKVEIDNFSKKLYSVNVYRDDDLGVENIICGSDILNELLQELRKNKIDKILNENRHKLL